ncbi:hypothetical protein ABGT15_04455 [Flavobacterium enshiense]|uniref:hypothetical protein n=1 Tax=Flavobacterium enshiense TaxID=1341165 RepID=UPI00345DBF2D
MNRYQLLKRNEKLIFQFVRNGILSYQIIRDIEIYERFDEMEEPIKDVKYLVLGEQYELSPNRIEQIITQMNRIIN